jgi:large conductance mechanosensitive channel
MIFTKLNNYKLLMSIIKEFKEFSVKGNALDLAVGVIIGAAFGKIISSLVNDVIMPPIGLLVGGINFTGLKVPLRNAVLDPAGKVINEAVYLNYGNFIQTAFDFFLIAFCVFMMIKIINSMKTKDEERVAKSVEPSAELRVMSEIRDLIKNKG